MAEFTIQQSDTTSLSIRNFLVRVGHSLRRKQNTNLAAGLLNQGRWAVAGLKKQQIHSSESFCECFDELHNSVELIETVLWVRTQHKHREDV